MSEYNEAITARLEALRAANNDVLTPEAIVQDARNPSSPLHSLFDWNVERAAHAYWVQRARQIMRTVTLKSKVSEHKFVEVPAYVRDPRQPHSVQGYIHIETAKSDQQLARDIIASEMAYAQQATRRAMNVSSVLNFTDDLQDISDRIEVVRDRVHKDKAA